MMVKMSVDKETVFPQDGPAEQTQTHPAERARNCGSVAAVATGTGPSFDRTVDFAGCGTQRERGPQNGPQSAPRPPPRPQRRCHSFPSSGSGVEEGRRRRRRVHSDSDPVLPTNFLLGGNIFDPLNLNSLLDEEVSRALNARTPESSPLPARSRGPVEILVPRDITDPLDLNGGSGGSPHRRRGPSGARVHSAAAIPEAAKGGAVPRDPTRDELSTSGPTTTATATAGAHHRKRKRLSSSKSDPASAAPSNKKERGPGTAGGGCPGGGAAGQRQRQQQQRQQKKFQFGNYNKYYGYRNPGGSRDPRTAALRPEWFRGKAVLDLGCNTGHLTLAIARDWRPARIVGLDIDGGLVHAARQNESVSFPVSLRISRGPIAAPPLPDTTPALPPGDFPANVSFVRGNYVLENDSLLHSQQAEFDVVLCLSVTKWVHLNWGDVGLQRLFRRVYRHLRPGGLFILEPQPWASYSKRRKITDTICKNYHSIQLKPEQFCSYLISEVGFSSYELLGTPDNSSRGFQRPIYRFHKGPPCSSE
ncbi:hypothetical protein AAFF_G00350670 [Aldrovandia affinis]|uniref:RNA methyltransferase n=1 Tax=Aldrovandia affinis TaxID=143900 RepID=A0AAD7R5Q8_9TELE|nr:hypothetical protein AAFF_G00350670 [Aldrovandia affinis]